MSRYHIKRHCVNCGKPKPRHSGSTNKTRLCRGCAVLETNGLRLARYRKLELFWRMGLKL